MFSWSCFCIVAALRNGIFLHKRLLNGLHKTMSCYVMVGHQQKQGDLSCGSIVLEENPPVNVMQGMPSMLIVIVTIDQNAQCSA